MAKIITIPEKKVTVFEFKELDPKIQQKVLEKNAYINVDGGFDWWDSTYEDAKRVGLDITGFDLDRPNYCKGKFIDVNHEVNRGKLTAKLILKEHGEQCETFKTAEKFLSELEHNKDNEDMIDDFLNDILEDYKTILKNEYEYLTSKEAIIETIEANDFQYLEDGTIY